MDSFLKIFKDVSSTKIILSGSVFLAMVISVIIFYFSNAPGEMRVLYSNLEIEDSNRIIEGLESRNISYELQMQGKEILVPSEKILKLRMEFAQEGIPSKGSIVGYEIFNESETLGTSQFIQNVNMIRALEGEIARTISTFVNIKSARVHLVLPKRELFSSEKRNPTASVILEMKGQKTLNKSQIDGITHLVATAVPSLEVKNITIVDTTGRSLKLGARDENDPGTIASTSEEFRISYEMRIKEIIESLLEKSVGYGKVKAEVSADLNFDRIVTNSEIYDPAGQVVRSTQTIEEKEQSQENDNNNNVTVQNNLPNPNATADSSINSNTVSRTDETTNYEITKIVKNHISETGTVKRLSIAVLVDGNYVEDKATGTFSYQPRSQEELQQLATLVKSAVGFDAKRDDKIEVVNMQFSIDMDSLKKEGEWDWVKAQLPSIIQTFVIGCVVVLVLVLIVRPIVVRAFEVNQDDAEEVESYEIFNKEVRTDVSNLEEIVEQETMAEISKIEQSFKSSPQYRSINEIISRYPQESATALRNWLGTNH